MPGLEPGDDRPLVKGPLQRVRGDVRDALRDATGPRCRADGWDMWIGHQIGQGHATERALVDEAKLRTVIGEVEGRLQMGLVRRAGCLDEQLTAHPEVNDEALRMTIGRLEHQPEVLASTFSGVNHVAVQSICQIHRPRQMPTNDAGTKEACSRDTAPDDVLLQSATDHLDLGKLRHPVGWRARPHRGRARQPTGCLSFPRSRWSVADCKSTSSGAVSRLQASLVPASFVGICRVRWIWQIDCTAT